MNGSEVVKTLKKSEFEAQSETLSLTTLLDEGDADITEKKRKLEGKEYPALTKRLRAELFLQIVTRLAVEPVVSDPPRKGIEESNEGQEEEAVEAIEMEENGWGS